jgi:hypothetical protein
MNRTCFPRLLFLVATGFCLAFSTAFGDDDMTPAPSDHPATLTDIHNLLLQAAGQSDNPPTIDEQTELLNKALKMILHFPHVYHGQLKAASRSIDAALNELANGDAAHKARADIFEADDRIKAIM